MKIIRTRKVTTDTEYKVALEVTVDFSQLNEAQVAEHAFNSIWINRGQTALRKLKDSEIDALEGKISILAMPVGQKSVTVLTPEQVIDMAMRLQDDVKQRMIRKIEESMKRDDRDDEPDELDN